MKSILVTKYGSVFRTTSKGASSSGEGGETLGILKHLVSRGDVEVVYFGAFDGDMPCEAVRSHHENVREYGTDPVLCPPEAQEADFALDVAALGDRDWVGCICVDGYAPTFSHIRNPNDAIIQCASINYTGPVLNVLEKLKLKRICINNDPRCFPKDQEMSHGWTYALPRAILGQCDNASLRTVGGKKYRRVSIHARAESWCEFQPVPHVPYEDRTERNVLAHSHVGHGIGTGDFNNWHSLLGSTCNVYGDGWHHYPWETAATFHGKIPQSKVPEVLLKTRVCPVVSHTPGFYTGKPYVLVHHGVVPVLHRSYDEKGLFGVEPYSTVPWDITRNEYESMLAHWRTVTQPRWEMLDRVVDELLNGTFEDFKYGGYIPC